MSADLHGRIETAQAALDRACQLLTDPTLKNLEDCLGGLSTAAASLSGLPVHAPDASLLSEAANLRRSVHRGASLLENAERYHATWFRTLCANTGGYTAEGDPVAMSGAARISLRG